MILESQYSHFTTRLCSLRCELCTESALSCVAGIQMSLCSRTESSAPLHLGTNRCRSLHDKRGSTVSHDQCDLTISHKSITLLERTIERTHELRCGYSRHPADSISTIVRMQLPFQSRCNAEGHVQNPRH